MSTAAALPIFATSTLTWWARDDLSPHGVLVEVHASPTAHEDAESLGFTLLGSFDITLTLVIDFKMLDEKGRKIGARVRLYTYPPHAGTAIVVEVWATRDGEVFGRVPPERYAQSLDEAKAIVDERLVAMVKRYAKQANLRAEGCYAKWADKETGVTLTLRDMDDDDPAAGRYMVVCEAHNTLVGVETKTLGRSTSSLDFCDECRDALTN